MGQVVVKVNGRDFALSCADGQEPRIRRLAQYVDAKIGEFAKNLGQIAEFQFSAAAGTGKETACGFVGMKDVQVAADDDARAAQLTENVRHHLVIGGQLIMQPLQFFF